METEHRRPTPACTFAATPPAGAYTQSFAVQHLADRGVPYSSELSDSAAFVTAELATNAVRHCGGTGRDFRLRLFTGPGTGVRIEGSDACADRPLLPGPPTPSDDLTSGHGLFLVHALAIP